MQLSIIVNGKKITAFENETILSVLQRAGYKIPTLCYMKGFNPTGACRLCVVEVEGKRELVTSCSFPVEPGLVVYTNTSRVIAARKALVELLLANHPDDCLYCERNGNCELQGLAEELNIKERNYFTKKNSNQRDHSSPGVFCNPAKCILCSRCIRVCDDVQMVSAIDLNFRGDKTTVNSAFNKGLNMSKCINCGQCIMACPTGALIDISHIGNTESNLTNSSVSCIALISGQFAVSVAEHFNLKPLHDPLGLIVSALKLIGFKHVHDMGWAHDLNIILESDLLLQKIKEDKNSLLLSSCCPAWLKYAEEFNPALLPLLSTVKSPQQIMGNIVKSFYSENSPVDKEKIFTVAFTVCVANKLEASREQTTHKGISEIDAVITVREFLRMLRSHGVDLTILFPEKPDQPFDKSSVSGLQFNYSGGKTEAIANQLNYKLNQQTTDSFKLAVSKNPASKKETKIVFGSGEIGLAWVSSTAETQNYLDEIQKTSRKDINYIEVMACPGGCTNGGGQPITRNYDKGKLRKKVCQELEKAKLITQAGLNKSIEEYITEIEKSNPDALKCLNTKF